MKKSVFFLLFVVFLTGCAVSEESIRKITTINVSYDKFEDSTKVEMNTPITSKSRVYDTNVEYNLVKIKEKNKESFYLALTLKYKSLDADGWFFIEDGDSLVMLIDGKKFVLTTFGSVNRRFGKEYLSDKVYTNFYEKVYYKIDKEFLEAFKSAKDIDFELMVENGYITSKNDIKNNQIDNKGSMIYIFRPDTPSIVGIAEVPFVYHNGVEVGRLKKGCFLEIPASMGINNIEIKASFLTFIPFYLLGKKEIEMNQNEEAFILFSADVDQAYKLQPEPPSTVFFFVDEDLFLEYKKDLILCK